MHQKGPKVDGFRWLSESPDRQSEEGRDGEDPVDAPPEANEQHRASRREDEYAQIEARKHGRRPAQDPPPPRAYLAEEHVNPEPEPQARDHPEDRRRDPLESTAKPWLGGDSLYVGTRNEDPEIARGECGPERDRGAGQPECRRRNACSGTHHRETSRLVPGCTAHRQTG
jgi:hypothetical protein